MDADVTIREVLVPALEAAFPGLGLRVSTPPEPVAAFPSACAEVGDLLIYDDGHEATVAIEHVTHHHSNPYDDDMTPLERANWVTRDVVEFVRELFSDRVFLWACEQGRRGGGWQRSYEGGIPPDLPDDADMFVWTKRIERIR